jgi:hypothetical protein
MASPDTITTREIGKKTSASRLEIAAAYKVGGCMLTQDVQINRRSTMLSAGTIALSSGR